MAGRGQGHQRIIDAASCDPELAQRLGQPAGCLLAHDKRGGEPLGQQPSRVAGSQPQVTGQAGQHRVGLRQRMSGQGNLLLVPPAHHRQVGGMSPHQQRHRHAGVDGQEMSPPSLVYQPENGLFVNLGLPGRDPDLSLLDQPGRA